MDDAASSAKAVQVHVQAGDLELYPHCFVEAADRAAAVLCCVCGVQ
jgi:hypothetical protein